MYLDNGEKDTFSTLYKDNAGTLYAFDAFTLRKSMDNAVTFGLAIDVFQEGSDAKALLDLGGGQLYLALSGGLIPERDGVYMSNNNGNYWTKTSLGLPRSQVLSLALGGDGKIYAGTDGAGLYRLTPGEGENAGNGCATGWCMSVVCYTSNSDGIISIPTDGENILNLPDTAVPTDISSGNIQTHMEDA